MTEQEYKNQLEKEGFKDIYVWEDGPLVEYPKHTHEKFTTHIILEGEMTLADSSGAKVLKVGDRLDILAGTVHSAKMGQEGCKYLVGEK
jgi:mannose-6-phosphate isomerase-like protein (cupin superfamily)